MANTIQEKITKFIPVLDKLYVKECKTAVLDGQFNSSWDEQCGGFKIASRDMDGLSAYVDKYPDGNIKLTWDIYKPNFNVGNRFTIPAIENMEVAGLELMDLLSDFEQYKVYPTLDAFRLSTYAGKAQLTKTEDLSNATAKTVLTALRKAQVAIEDNEADPNNCIVFIAPALYNLVADADTITSKAIMGEFGGFVKVPQKRLYTGGELVDLQGWQPNADSTNLNFVIVDKTKALQAHVRKQTKIFTPNENPNSDGYLMPYHLYSMADLRKSAEQSTYASISTTKTIE